MDFKGQYYCERTFQILVVLFGIIGFFAGYLQQDFRLTFYFLATGGGLSALVCAACSLRVLGSARVNKTCLPTHLTRLINPCTVPYLASQICLPDWPWWNRHPLEWLEPLEDEEEEPKEKVKKVKKEKKKEKSK